MVSTRNTVPAILAILSTLVSTMPVDAQQAAPAKPLNASSLAFRDTVDNVSKAPPGYTHFKLSHQYPTKDPGSCSEADCPWLKVKVDFKTKFPSGRQTELKPSTWHEGKWDEYLQLVLDYVKKGQDPNLADNVGFKTVIDGQTRWYNVPWMAYDPTVGREFVHGTTNERTAHVSDLVPGTARTAAARLSATKNRQVANKEFRGISPLALMVTPNLDNATEISCEQQAAYGFETWSVGFYNAWGGYAMGQAFPSTGKPQIVEYLGSEMPAGLPFPQGTVVTKVLTTTASPTCVDSLKGAPEWHVNRHKFDPTKGYQCDRAVQTTRVLQIDVAVVDKRSPTRWVYGTFAYDGNRQGATFWDKLVPVGAQWGADPWTFPAVPMEASLQLQQSVLNPESNKSPMSHYGCPGPVAGSHEELGLLDQRLAGPVDNKQSSCISCHSSAYAAPHGAPSTMGSNVPPSFGFDGMCTTYSLDNAAYFQNQQPPQHFPGGRFPDAISLDTSLQMEVAFDQYGRFHTDGAPLQCDDDTINQVTPTH